MNKPGVITSHFLLTWENLVKGKVWMHGCTGRAGNWLQLSMTNVANQDIGLQCFKRCKKWKDKYSRCMHLTESKTAPSNFICPNCYMQHAFNHNWSCASNGYFQFADWTKKFKRKKCVNPKWYIFFPVALLKTEEQGLELYTFFSGLSSSPPPPPFFPSAFIPIQNKFECKVAPQLSFIHEKFITFLVSFMYTI